MSGMGGLPRLAALPERPHAVKPPPMVRIAPVTKPASVPFRKSGGLVDALGRRVVAMPGPARAPQTANAGAPGRGGASRAERGISSAGLARRGEPGADPLRELIGARVRRRTSRIRTVVHRVVVRNSHKDPLAMPKILHPPRPSDRGARASSTAVRPVRLELTSSADAVCRAPRAQGASASRAWRLLTPGWPPI